MKRNKKETKRKRIKRKEYSSGYKFEIDYFSTFSQIQVGSLFRGKSIE